MERQSVHPSQWGPGDQLGAANEVTSELTRRALRLAETGRVFDLTQVISVDAPRLSVMSPYSMCMWSHPFPSQRMQEIGGAANGIGFADERVEMDLHIGTHVDALGHCWIADQGYNGFTMRDTVGNFGLLQLGIENLPPLITRGVLIDLTQTYGGPLEAGYVVTPDDIEGALRKQAVAIEPGDIALIRTGWGNYYTDQKAAYVGSAPGIGVAAANWLADQRIVVAGSDTMLLEVWPAESTNMPWAVHQHLLVNRGVYILENAYLEVLAEARHYTFLCMCLAEKFRGATASPVRLVAVV